jgi:ankyrin repeat protein
MSDIFFKAIQSGDAAQVSALIAADPGLLEAKNEQGLGPFTVARYSRQEAIANLLLEKGVSLDIFAACMAGEQSRVAELLTADPGLMGAYSHDGWTPLHLAAFFGHTEIAEAMLAGGANANARSTNAMANTPLHAAVAGRKRADVATVLLAHGADVNARQHGGWTPLHAAAQSGDEELVRLLIAAGADVKARAENNQNARDLAMLKGHQALVEVLEEYGAE